MNLNKMRGNGQPQKKRSGVRLLLSMLVIMSVVFLLTACSISVGDIGFEITSIDNDGNVKGVWNSSYHAIEQCKILKLDIDKNIKISTYLGGV